jgi:hypothetical protein
MALCYCDGEDGDRATAIACTVIVVGALGG